MQIFPQSQPSPQHLQGPAKDRQWTATFAKEWILSAGVILLALKVLVLGWGFGISSITSFGHTFSAMVPSTAILFLIASLALLLGDIGFESRIVDRTSRLAGAAIIAIAAVNLAVAASGVAAGVDALLWSNASIFETERMSEATSVSFLLLGWCLCQRPSRSKPADGLIGCATLGVILSLLALIVFTFDARSLQSAALYSTMSLPTALAFLMLFCVILLREKESGWIAVLMGDGRGSFHLRRVLPWIIGLPLVLSLASNISLRLGLFDQNFQMSILALGTVLTVGSILIHDAHKSNAFEAEGKAARLRAETAEARQTELTQRRIAAEMATMAKTKFLANMSHELRTPMNGILGFSDLLLNEDLPQDHRAKIALIHESGQMMLKLIDDILDLSKIDTGHLVVVREPVDIRHVAQSCMKMFQVAAAQKGLALEMHVADDTPQFAHADILRTRQVLTNIIGNALKFTEEGRVDLNIRQNAGAVELVIEDTGIGIAEENLADVLGEFVQADDTTQRRFGGSGLGLHISSKLIEMMEGSLAISSVEGAGTQVTVTLPLYQPQEELQPAENPAISVAEGEGFHRKRIAVAEDHDINQILITDMLQRLGAHVTMFGNGREAVDGITKAKEADELFDLVLMDIQMPEMDGIAAAQELRSRGFSAADLPIVAMTANAFESDVEDCLAAGMQAHLSKPISFGRLTKALGGWFDKPDQFSLAQGQAQPI